MSYPHLVFAGEESAATTVREHALKAASGFAALGVGEGDVVAVMLRNEPEAIEAILAAGHLGAYWCGLNWHFKGEEAAWVLADSRAKLLVIHADLIAQVQDALPPSLPVIAVRPRASTRRMYGLPDAIDLPDGMPEWDGWIARLPASRVAPKRPKGLMPYTSGVSGRPKGVVRIPLPEPEAEALAAAAAKLATQVLGVTAQARCLLAAPLYHSAPGNYVAACARAGARLWLEPRFDAERLLQLISQERITHLYLVPTMYQRLLALPRERRVGYDLRSVQFVASTGSPCPASVKHAMIEWLGPVIHEAYASSETGYLTFITAEEWLRKPGSVGRAVGDAVIRILDEHGAAQPAGEVGVIYGRQPASPDFTYINNAEARARIERNGLVTVGDLGYVDDDGYLFISGRQSDMVISGGVNIYAAEIEAVLSRMPGLADCAVFGVPDEEWGEALVAAVVPDADGEHVDAQAVRAFVREHMAGYKVPKFVTVESSLPREDTGKVYKRRVREAFLARKAAAAPA
ncbi:AMP-binding protein [Variovorax sp. KK3]|uniref:AMP-binding protein n=1 Tax=Variovorax sp. KK3 TaxID=1855728 RepID=UPI00097BD8A8|nr:AMP-binding protein [Variovorax sp. KK3]